MSTLTVSPKATFSGSIRTLLASHPFISYFVLAFTGTWLFTAPMVLGQDGLSLLPYSVPFGLYVVLFLASSFTGPTLAAIAVTAALDGKEGVKRFFRRYVQWRIGWQWYLFMLFGFPAIYFIAATFWMGLAPLQALAQQWRTFFTLYLPALLIFPGLLQWGEEPGWRGFAQTRMQAHYGPLSTTLLVGFLHGIWHLPNHLLVVGPPAAGPFDLSNFVLNTVIVMALTIVLTWIFNGAQQSILAGVFAHAAFNAAGAWSGTLLPNQGEQVAMTALMLIVVFAVMVVFLTKGKLGHNASKDPNVNPNIPAHTL
jgi:membrane protease YdiL (CAAX protease family)